MCVSLILTHIVKKQHIYEVCVTFSSSYIVSISRSNIFTFLFAILFKQIHTFECYERFKIKVLRQLNSICLKKQLETFLNT